MTIPKQITYKKPTRILTPTGGYLSGYSHSLNPYTGCAFGCSFCYVRQMPVNLFRKEEWGTWVDVKEQAANKLRKELTNAKKRGPVTIFMSSSTDPYQPVEYNEKVTRSLLQVMVEQPPSFLFVQTRSPLVTRDIDYFKQLKRRIRVSMTIETDDERVRKQLTPEAPPVQARAKAVSQLIDANIPVQIAVSPILPHSPQFATWLCSFHTKIVVDDFFQGDGSKGTRTNRNGIPHVYEKLGYSAWYSSKPLERLYRDLKRFLSSEKVWVSQDGFLPD